MKKLLYVFAVILLTATFILIQNDGAEVHAANNAQATNSTKSVPQNLEVLEVRMNELSKDVQLVLSAAANVNILGNNVTALQVQSSLNTSDIQKLKSSGLTIESSIASLQGALSSLVLSKADSTTLNTLQSNFNTNIAIVNDQILKLQAGQNNSQEVSLIQAAIQSNETKLNGVQTQLAVLNSSYESQNLEISGLRSAINTLSQKVDSNPGNTTPSIYDANNSLIGYLVSSSSENYGTELYLKVYIPSEKAMFELDSITGKFRSQMPDTGVAAGQQTNKDLIYYAEQDCQGQSYVMQKLGVSTFVVGSSNNFRFFKPIGSERTIFYSKSVLSDTCNNSAGSMALSHYKVREFMPKSNLSFTGPLSVE